jgi:DNA-binding beta-propeller fold protein YncE
MFIRKTSFILSILFSLLFINSAVADSDTLEQVWELDGLTNPESVVYDPRLNILYVSNMNGAPNEKDNNGFISIVSVNGNMLNEKWIEGLDAPKGLAVYGSTLYVADIDQLVAIDIDHGRIINRYRVDDAKFFNDVDNADNGDVYVSDMVLNRIHKLSGDDFSIWIESEELDNPNGLHFTEDDIIVGSWGKMTDGFATEVPGHLKRISINTKNISSIGDGTPVGNLDGVEGNDETGFYVTDWLNGGLFRVDVKGTATKLLEFEQGSADHDLIEKKNLLVIPHMKENRIIAYKIK